MSLNKKKDTIGKMFDDISSQYDFLNHFLSLGIDIIWRKKLVNMLSTNHPSAILDVATGTGDLAIELSRLNPKKIVGIDISKKMLEIAEEKVKKKHLDQIISFRLSDAEKIPFSNNSFDAVTVAFGVRNYENLKNGITEMRRVLKPGGQMLILEFSHPSVIPVKQFYQLYSRFFIPFFGRIISKNSSAYRYLPESVAAFPSGERFLDVLQEAGMVNRADIKLSFGIATLYSCEKSL